MIYFSATGYKTLPKQVTLHFRWMLLLMGKEVRHQTDEYSDAIFWESNLSFKSSQSVKTSTSG